MLPNPEIRIGQATIRVSRRFRFVHEQVAIRAGGIRALKGRRIPAILNIGCGNEPMGLSELAVHIDIDRWRCKYFLQTDAHQLPFKNDSFDIVVLGDIIEHLLDPLMVLQEAKRVGKYLVMTIFEEWRLGGPGQHIEKGLSVFGEPNLREYIETGQLLQALPENIISHNIHINQFTDEAIDKMIDSLVMTVIWRSKEPEYIYKDEKTGDLHTWYNWLISLEKSAMTGSGTEANS